MWEIPMVFLRRNGRWPAALGKSESAEKKAALPIDNTAKSRTVIPRRGIVPKRQPKLTRISGLPGAHFARIKL